VVAKLIFNPFEEADFHHQTRMALVGLSRLPNELIRLVGQYAISPPVKFLDWIDPKKINWAWLSSNRYWLSMNPAAIPLLEKHPEKIDWVCLSSNPAAMPLLEHPEKINWAYLSRHSAIIDKKAYKPTRKLLMFC
jgi:hypothetical protein